MNNFSIAKRYDLEMDEKMKHDLYVDDLGFDCMCTTNNFSCDLHVDREIMKHMARMWIMKCFTSSRMFTWMTKFHHE